MFRKLMNEIYTSELQRHYDQIAPEFLTDQDKVPRDIYLRIARLNMLAKMAGVIMFSELTLIIVMFTLLMKKGVL